MIGNPFVVEVNVPSFDHVKVSKEVTLRKTPSWSIKGTSETQQLH